MSAPRSSFGSLPLNKHFKTFDVQNGGVIFFFRDLEAFFEAGQTTNLRNISLPLDEYVRKTPPLPPDGWHQSTVPEPGGITEMSFE